ncbi:MAG: mevalonate kinase [Thermoleophilaceae bacterium]
MRPASAEAPARAALAGNPSDGYGGRTLAVTLPAFRARVEVEPADRFDVAEPLLAAAFRRFARGGVGADPPPLRMRFSTSIPRQVGLGGSSAIVVAALRALCTAFETQLTPATLAMAALEAETEELGIEAGPQDRIVQSYGGLVAMDFDPRHGPGGAVRRLDEALLPPLFVAWQREPAASSNVFHEELRRRYDAGDPTVRRSMMRLARLALEARDALQSRDQETFARCLDDSFDLRSEMAELDPAHVKLVELARSLGAAANFTGSGGAVVGTIPEGIQPNEITAAFDAEGCAVDAPAKLGLSG